MSSTWKVVVYIYFFIIYPKADGYTVQLEKKNIKNAFSVLNPCFFVYFWEYERLVMVTEYSIATKRVML